MFGLNKQQLRRFHLVALIPLLLLGVWFADGEFENYFPTKLWSYCSLDGGCRFFKSVNEMDSDDGINFKLPVVGVWDGGINQSFESHDFSPAKFNGSIDEPILSIQGNVASRLIINRNDRHPFYSESFNGCDFYQIKVVSIENSSAGVATKAGDSKAAPYTDIFNFDCGAKSKNWFIFTNPEVQRQYINLFETHRRNMLEHKKEVARYNLISFFVPLILYFLLFSAILLVNSVIRFVRFGLEKK